MGSLRWKRHRKLVFVTLAGFTVLLAGFGNTRVTALTSSERSPSTAFVSVDIQGLVDLFDDSAVHEIEVTFDQADYERMIETYQAEGIKEYIEASVTIDGTTISSVGLRLKGNSTLAGLGGPAGQLRGPGGEGEISEGFSPAPNQQGDGTGDDATEPDAGLPPAATEGEFGRQVGGLGGDVSADDPSSLPWLLSFDEYVEGQRYQGLTEIAIRPSASSQTMLNEALALNLVAAAGEPSQRAGYTSFTINGSDAQLRLIVEIPGESYAAETFENDGVLYKALSTGQFAYRGDDPLAYEDDFKQITRENQQDLKPLINLLKWVSEASDEEFAEELDEYVDIESLARYIALQELLQNFDDMSGPGHNYYLWYDLEVEKFTVVAWDMNLAFGQGGVGGALQFDRPQVPGAGQADGDGEGGQLTPQLPDGQSQEDADGQARPPLVQGGEFPGGGQVGRGVAGAGGGNVLKERFLETDAFDEIYARAYQELYAAIYGSGLAAGELDRLSAIVEESGLVDDATIESDISSLRAAVETQVAAGPDIATAPGGR